ncbi:UvrABC system protein C [Thermaurantimonas aggregans]|uniref:UvrABC system protein C n=1 Tax=Thermaurantimonas aggregans TaxID=2173829 RepID=A0A401XLP3_9FLAO|nr:excinuclease ABC subunit UvrC [Thermaurantimonas aggregans]MCX8147814.1 excinuclease ABC subunit UvrC [Thermaurantimonas aggregans]GCD77936.1 UvrABC system protein C [Thermaurantimonas aggregans]
MEISEHITNLLKTLPEKPGVYQHLDKEGNILYIGKAKNLKKRVSSYFQKEHTSGRLAMLVRKVADIQVIVTETEFDALLLENNLIKKYQPRYNINLKDDKTYPWICITNEDFPRIFPTRKKVNDGSSYYGPYASVKVMRTVLELIRTLYPVRTCKMPMTVAGVQAGKYKVCLEYHMGNCRGPCEGLQSKEDYQREIEGARHIIKGHLNIVKQILIDQMQALAAEMRFEEAQKTKEKLDALLKYQAKSSVVDFNIKEADVFGAVSDAEFCYVNYLKIVDGGIINSFSEEFRKKIDETESEILELAIPHFRKLFESEAREIYTSHSVELEIPNVKIHTPTRGEKRDLVELSVKNAGYHRLERLKNLQITDPDRHVNRLMQQMKADLGIDQEPRHIECFDNSNIMGTNPVSACVVFRDGKPSKKEYRHFNVKTVEGPDDFATMREVVYRRYRRMLDEGQPLPQLIVIDGGKGQLNAALQSLRELGIDQQMRILGIAKRLEELYFPNDPLPLMLNKKSETLKVLQHIRDEAHRFGLTHHRKRRTSSALKTELTKIDGIGEATAEALIKKFGSVKKIKTLTLDQLAEVIGKSKAQKIFSYFHRENVTKS